MRSRDEPTLDELLEDPVACALMRRDGVEAAEVRALMRDLGRRLSAAGKGGGGHPGGHPGG